MRGPHNIWRLIRTAGTFERTGAMRVVMEAADMSPGLRMGARVLGFPFRFVGYKGDAELPPLVRALVALGPAYIKFGQLLSTRPDIVGVEMASELGVLQDRLPAFSSKEARETIKAELGADVDELFASFDEPIAAASLAQVHPAMSLDGEKLAVKVLRPGIERAFLRDVDAFHLGAALVEILSPRNRRLRPRAVVEHFEQVVRSELDLRMEAAVGSEYAENTKEDTKFFVPKIDWQHSSRRVLTTQWLEGEALSDPETLENAIDDRHEFASLIMSSFLTQALRDGLFHADMHHGNLKIMPDGRLGAIDFGIMGRIDAYTRRVYAEILYGFLNRNYQRVAEVHFEAGYVPANQDQDAFAQALRSVGEPIFGQDAENISIGHLLGHLFEITENFGMQTRTELILLQRTMVVVEGVARSIDPDINMWETARPAVENYIKTQLGLPAFLRDLERTVNALARFGPQLPDLLEQTLLPKAPPKPAPFPKRAIILTAAISVLASTLVFALIG